MLSTRPSVAEIVDRTLRSIREPLAGFVQEMTAKAVAEGLTDQDTIDGTVNKIGYGRQIAELDTRILLKLMEKVWNPVFWNKPGRLGRTYAAELHFFSNAQSHQHDPKTFDAERLVDTAIRLLIECGVDLPDDLQALRRANRRGSEPPFETEPEVKPEGKGATRVEDMIHDMTTVLQERLAHLSVAVARNNETLAVLLERTGRKTSEPEQSESRQAACTDRQAGAIFRLLVELGVSTADDDAVGDALDDRRFDGSHIKTWCSNSTRQSRRTRRSRRSTGR